MAGENVQSGRIMAGIPETNAALFHRLRFSVGDPTVLIELPAGDGFHATLILRDIEMQRARQHARADAIACPADFAPAGGLSGDRETATAQAAAEFLRRADVRTVVGDRSLPLIYAEAIREAGIALECDSEWGVLSRRAKDEQEVEWLRKSQEVTEGAMQMACQMVARATAGTGGQLLVDDRPLTSERVRAAIDHWLLDHGFSNPPSIVAGGPAGADCHDRGSGVLRTGQPVIIDIFPRDKTTHYYGDCTRTVVHGEISDTLVEMHQAVVAAKEAGVAATRAGVSGEAVHLAIASVITQRGYAMGLPDEEAAQSYCAMTHGSGHGIGLDVHEPPLLDYKGPELVTGDALTIEPGLYRRDLGGIRVEDMVVVTDDGCINLNRLPGDLVWD